MEHKTLNVIESNSKIVRYRLEIVYEIVGEKLSAEEYYIFFLLLHISSKNMLRTR